MAEGGWPIAWPSEDQIRAEAIRTSAELMWALHRQRQAWAKMARLKAHYDSLPNHEFLDNERAWSLAVGDVKFWTAQLSARSNAMAALVAMAREMDIDVVPPDTR